MPVIGRASRRWRITVIDPATEQILFGGQTEDEAELNAVAAEARRLRPLARIVIRPPMGAPHFEWSAEES